MSNTFEIVLIGLAVIAFVTYRLSRWQSVAVAKLLQMPLVLIVVAAVSLSRSTAQLAQITHLPLLDVVILGFELVVGAGVGWILGGLTEIRTFADGTRSRLTGPGIAVFLGFVAVRIGLGILAGALGATLAAMPAITLLVLAVIKTVQGLIVRRRVVEHHKIERQRVYADTWR